jgi:hypothetical protein
MPPKKLTQDSQSPVLDFNPGHLEYEVGCARQMRFYQNITPSREQV